MRTMKWLAVTVSLGACAGGSVPSADPVANPEAPADVDAPPAEAAEADNGRGIWYEDSAVTIWDSRFDNFFSRIVDGVAPDPGCPLGSMWCRVRDRASALLPPATRAQRMGWWRRS